MVSGYYAWRDRGPSQREQDNAELVRRIRKIHVKSSRRYGCPNIWNEIRKEGGITCGRHRIARLMRQNRIRSETKRSFRVTTTNSDHRLPIAHNILNRSFSAAAPNLRWASDTTCLPKATPECRCHLQHEPNGKLLGQCRRRKLFCNTQSRMLSRPGPIQKSCRREGWHLRVHRSRVQQTTSPFNARLS
jgi:hypothetical protein